MEIFLFPDVANGALVLFPMKSPNTRRADGDVAEYGRSKKYRKV